MQQQHNRTFKFSHTSFQISLPTHTITTTHNTVPLTLDAHLNIQTKTQEFKWNIRLLSTTYLLKLMCKEHTYLSLSTSLHSHLRQTRTKTESSELVFLDGCFLLHTHSPLASRTKCYVINEKPLLVSQCSTAVSVIRKITSTTNITH